MLDSEKTWYYKQTEDGEIVKDEEILLNPKPHAVYSKGKKLYTKPIGFLPPIESHEPFEVLGTKVMYPSAFGIGSEDINYRCVIHQRARWALGEKELETLKHRAKKHGLQIGDKEYLNK